MVQMVKNGGPDLKRARRTGLSAQRAQRTKSIGPKGLQLEVGARRAPRLLYAIFLDIFKMEGKFYIVTGGVDGIIDLIRRSCFVSTILILVQIGSEGFRWIQMDLKWKMERKFGIVTGVDGISGLIRRSCLVSTILILVQIGSEGFRWIQMDLKWKIERKFGIVTGGVDGISGLIRRSCHPDPPIATILTPPAEPPAEREADPIHLEWLLQIGTSFTQKITTFNFKTSGQRVGHFS